MSTGGIGSYAEHHFRKVIPGNIEAVRARLCDVLEDFDYVVLNENPIQAKRGAQKNVMTANILEYDTRLTIALRPVSSASTLATFDYAVQHIFSKAEKITLEREADAIISLATAPLRKSVCPACETENIGAVRFCRVCGTPIARSKLPAELEVMRLMAGSSASFIEIAWGLGIALLTLAVTIPIIMLGKPKGVIAGWVMLALGELMGLLMLAFGMWRLNRTITTNQAAQPEAQVDAPRQISRPERAALPAQPASITEGTTELMSPSEQPVHAARDKDTGSMEESLRQD
jgi:hypothetical protein